VKWDNGAKSYVDCVVYDTATGNPKTCYPVDVRELIASGAYSYGPPDLSAPEQAPEPETVASERRGPGRPRKEDS